MTGNTWGSIQEKVHSIPLLYSHNPGYPAALACLPAFNVYILTALSRRPEGNLAAGERGRHGKKLQGHFQRAALLNDSARPAAHSLSNQRDPRATTPAALEVCWGMRDASVGRGAAKCPEFHKSKIKALNYAMGNRRVRWRCSCCESLLEKAAANAKLCVISEQPPPGP